MPPSPSRTITGHPATRRFPPALYGWYVVGLCTLAYVLSFVDRQILSLLIGPIQADLHISDTAFALLHGFAFSLFYATLGIPLAGLTDRVSRVRVIAGGIGVWSLATVACGLASSFGQLLLARIMVGAGEAALSPAAYALINDLFPRHRLGRALGVYALGSFLGSGLAFLTGGAVMAAAGQAGTIALGGVTLRIWQACFMLVGVPGVALAVLVGLTIRDPRRAAPPRADAPCFPPLGAVLRWLWRDRAISAPHLAGYALSGWALFATLAWAPAVAVRGFGMGTAQVGLWLGINAMVAGGGGALASGWLLDRLARAGKADATFVVGMVGGLGCVGSAALLAFGPLRGVALAGLVALQFFSSFPITPSGALIQMRAPHAMRARVSAILICCTGLVGAGLGTLLVGLLSDHLFRAGDGVVGALALVAGLGGALSAAILACGGAAARRQAVPPAATLAAGESIASCTLVPRSG